MELMEILWRQLKPNVLASCSAEKTAIGFVGTLLALEIGWHDTCLFYWIHINYSKAEPFLEWYNWLKQYRVVIEYNNNIVL